MELMPKELERMFARIGRQDNFDPFVVAKYFYPLGGMTWYATEYCQEDRTFFGYADLEMGCPEWGYFSLTEMEETKIGPFQMGIERDLYFRPTLISQVRRDAWERIQPTKRKPKEACHGCTQTD